jgi:hypothetical protein
MARHEYNDGMVKRWTKDGEFSWQEPRTPRRKKTNCIVAWVAAPSLLLGPLVLRSNRRNRNRQHRSRQSNAAIKGGEKTTEPLSQSNSLVGTIGLRSETRMEFL